MFIASRSITNLFFIPLTSPLGRSEFLPKITFLEPVTLDIATKVSQLVNSSDFIFNINFCTRHEIASVVVFAAKCWLRIGCIGWKALRNYIYCCQWPSAHGNTSNKSGKYCFLKAHYFLLLECKYDEGRDNVTILHLCGVHRTSSFIHNDKFSKLLEGHVFFPI